MKKQITFIAGMMLGVLFFNACNENEPGKGGLTISSDDLIAFPVEGGKFEIDIKTNDPWTADFDENITWATVTPESGTGKGYVTVAAEPNYTQTGRYVRLNIAAKGEKKAVDIEQAAGSGVSRITSAKTIDAVATGAAYTFSLGASGSWQLSASEDWVRFETKRGPGRGYISYVGASAKGANDSTLTVYVNPNLGDALRSAYIILKSDLSADTITVTQPNVAFDYYKDGELIPLYTNPDRPNSGAPLVIIGDGWGVEDLKKGGLWEQWATGLKDILFQIEMGKDFRDLIDVYAVATLSNQRGIYANNRFGTIADVSWPNYETMKSVGRQALNKINHPNVPYVTFIASSNGRVGGYNLGDLCVLSTPDGESQYIYWMLHEYLGHTFANLVDLSYDCKYGTIDWPYPDDTFDPRNTPEGTPGWNWHTTADGKTFPACFTDGHCSTDSLYEERTREWALGYSWMVDFTSDPGKVVWKDFIGRPGYDQVGVYPTAWSFYCHLFGPEAKTAMRENPHYSYDVGSRYQIWKKAYVRSGRYPESDTGFLNVANFLVFDRESGYADNGERFQRPNQADVQSPYAELFTKSYWLDNELHPQKPGFTKQN
ncbi:MAG: BACON domain-containing protein [Dysgonamonadaceae bacterium]|nr:BACON domain-containing protein [Dysgonamonadaceae bacterium]